MSLSPARSLVALLSIFLLTLASRQATAQRAYEIVYRTSNDTATAAALLVQFSTGEGYARFRYTDSISGESFLMNYTVREEPFTGPDGHTSLDTTILRFMNPRAVGPVNTRLSYEPAPLVCITRQATEGPEPAAILVSLEKNGLRTSPFFTAPVPVDKITNPYYIRQYFVSGDPIYDAVNDMGRDANNYRPARGKKLHLIMAASTADSVLGSFAQRDLINTMTLFYFTCLPLGFTIDTTIIRDGRFNRNNVIKTIQQLQSDTGDVIVFYYSGHGFNEMKEKRAYPRMLLTNEPYHLPVDEFAKQSVNINDVYQAILKKKARSRFVISDCCNSTNTAYAKIRFDDFIPPVPAQRGSVQFNPKATQKLFLESRVNMLAVATSKGEKARTANSSMGSFFSWSFQMAMQEALSLTSNLDASAFPDWQTISTITKAKLNYYMNRVCLLSEKEKKLGEKCKMTPLITIEKAN